MKDIPGFTGYQVDEYGIVYHNGIPRKVSSKKGFRNYITIYFPWGQRQQVSVARLVLLGWEGEPSEGLVPCYKDGNPDNLNPRNLYWGTKSEQHRMIREFNERVGNLDDKRVKRNIKKTQGVIYKVDKETNELVESYDNVNSASLSMDVPSTFLLNAAINGSTCCNYKWVFAEEFDGEYSDRE